MKIMTCRQLGGACDLEFHAKTFEEVAQLSHEHGKEMHQKQDPAHLQAMQEMTELMKDSQAMKEWMKSKRKEFEALPEERQ